MTEHYLDRLARTINANWNEPALTDFYLTEDGTAQDTSRGNHYTYGEMYSEIVRVADYLERLGLQKGDHIAICGANSAHWVIAYLAIASYQGVIVTILHTQSSEDIVKQIDFSDAKVLFTDEDMWLELKKQSLPLIKHVISLENWEVLYGVEVQISNQYLWDSIQKVCFESGSLDDTAIICFTSGSAGVPKGVMLSNRNITNNVSKANYPLTSNKHYLSLVPYAHTGGLIGEFLSNLEWAKYVHILKGTSYFKDIKNAYNLISPYMIGCAPDLFRLVYMDKQTGSILLNNTCEIIFMGGAKLDDKLEQEIIESGIPLMMVYGQTETGSTISLSPYGYHRVGSSGKIVEGMTARIAENGEILVKGENVMLGYYKNPEATAQKIDADGWLHTGDRGHLDEDGYLYVEGRLEQDMIVLPNGENIHPDNIERKINALPEVAESIVIARGGNLVAIVVPSSVEHHDLRRFILRAINPQLPSYSQLYDVECINEPLARTAKQTLKRYLYK